MDGRKAWRRDWIATARSFLPVLPVVVLCAAALVVSSQVADSSAKTIWGGLTFGAAFALVVLLVALRKARRQVRRQLDDVASARPGTTVFLVHPVPQALTDVADAGRSLRLAPPAPSHHALVIGPEHVELHPLAGHGPVTVLPCAGLAVRVLPVDIGPLKEYLTLHLAHEDGHVHVAVSGLGPSGERTARKALAGALRALGHEPETMPVG